MQIQWTSPAIQARSSPVSVEKASSVEIQKEAAKLLKVTTIMPYRLMSGLITEEIDDD